MKQLARGGVCGGACGIEFQCPVCGVAGRSHPHALLLTFVAASSESPVKILDHAAEVVFGHAHDADFALRILGGIARVGGVDHDA